MHRCPDYELLISSLSRLRQITALTLQVSSFKLPMEQAIAEVDIALPDLLTLRNTLEHADEYAVDNGRNSNISQT